MLAQEKTALSRKINMLLLPQQQDEWSLLLMDIRGVIIRTRRQRSLNTGGISVPPHVKRRQISLQQRFWNISRVPGEILIQRFKIITIPFMSNPSFLKEPRKSMTSEKSQYLTIDLHGSTWKQLLIRKVQSPPSSSVSPFQQYVAVYCLTTFIYVASDREPRHMLQQKSFLRSTKFWNMDSLHDPAAKDGYR